MTLLEALLMRRCMVLRNRDPGESCLLQFDPSESMEELMALVARSLPADGAAVEKLFAENGREIENPQEIYQNDVVFCAARGEEFLGRAQLGRRGAVRSTFKISVLGSGAVGKSALTLQYVQRVFYQDYDPTIEDAYRKNMVLDDEPVMLDILDTAGQEDYIAYRGVWAREKDGFLLVFSLADRRSMLNLKSFFDMIHELYDEWTPPIVLVGNKVDLERQVSHEEALQFAKANDVVEYLETSAKSGQNVDLMFETVLRHAKKVRVQKELLDRKSHRVFYCCCPLL